MPDDVAPGPPPHQDRQPAPTVLLDMIWGGIASKFPAFLSLFAAAFVVGYFYAIDISWFSLFSLTDLLVFALRSLPLAVGATLLLLVFLKMSLHEAERKEQTQKSSSDKLESISSTQSETVQSIDTTKVGPSWRRVLPALWSIFMFGIAAYMFHRRYIGAAVNFFFIACGTIYFEYVARFKRAPLHIMYWCIQVTIICLIVGFVSGSFYNRPLRPSEDYTVSVLLKSDSKEPELKGRLIFSGANGVLIYDYVERQVKLVRWNNIEEMCSKPDPPGTRLSPAPMPQPYCLKGSDIERRSF
jgi:hypothetical protein